jgi:hypothetical protein
MNKKIDEAILILKVGYTILEQLESEIQSKKIKNKENKTYFKYYK